MLRMYYSADLGFRTRIFLHFCLKTCLLLVCDSILQIPTWHIHASSLQTAYVHVQRLEKRVEKACNISRIFFLRKKLFSLLLKTTCVYQTCSCVFVSSQVC